MKYLILVLTAFLLFACEKAIDCGEGSVSLQVINHSDVDFDTIRFSVATDLEHTRDIVITDLGAGDSSAHQYLDQLNYMFYEDQSEFLFFTNYWYGVTHEDTLYGTGYGFCGTGLQNITVSQGTFIAEITGIDEENGILLITQYKE
jgi:hypothetical protein